MRRAKVRMLTTRSRCSSDRSPPAAFPVAVLKHQRILTLAGLHLGNSSEVSLENRVSKLFERVGSLARPPVLPGCRRLLEQMVARLKLSSEPLGDPRTAVVRLVTELSGELALGLALEQGNVLCPVVKLGVGERQQRECSGATGRVLVAVL